MVKKTFGVFLILFLSEFSFGQNSNICKDQNFSTILENIDTSFTVFLSGEVHHKHNNEKISIELFKQLYIKHNVRLFLFELGYCDAILFNNYLAHDDSVWFMTIPYSPSLKSFSISLKHFYDSLPVNDKFQVVGVDYEKGIDIFLIPALKTLLLKGDIDTTLISTKIILAGIKENELSGWIYPQKVPTIIAALKSDIEMQEQKMIQFWGEHYATIKKIIYKRDKSIDVNPSNNKGKGNEKYLKREEYIYNNILELHKEFPNKNMYGQFGRVHVPISRQIKYEKWKNWESFAGKLNTRDDSPLKNKVCSFYIYYSDRYFERKFYISQKKEILEKIKTVEKNDLPMLVDLKCIDSVGFNNFTKTTFQYLIVNHE